MEEAPEEVGRALGPQLLAGVQLEPVLGRKDLAQALANCEGHDGDGDRVHEDLEFLSWNLLPQRALGSLQRAVSNLAEIKTMEIVK